MRKLSSVLLSLLFAGCGGGATTVDMTSTSNDMAVASTGKADMTVQHDMFVLSACGHPGDVGNSLGVGAFCMGFVCTGSGSATLCSASGNGATPSANDSYFCTILGCAGKPASYCGENAYCNTSDPRASVCTPNECGGPDDGGTASDGSSHD